MGRSWHVLIRHVERVKWYAPHIRHVVLDIECRPHQAASPAPEQATVSAPDQAMDHSPDQATRPAPNQATHAAPEQAAGPAPDQAASQGRPCGTVAEHIVVTREEFERCISAKKEPAVLKGLHLGPAVARLATRMIMTSSLLCTTTMDWHSLTKTHISERETQRTWWKSHLAGILTASGVAGGVAITSSPCPAAQQPLSASTSALISPVSTSLSLL